MTKSILKTENIFLELMNNTKLMTEEKKEKDTHSYKGWLNSDYFLKRAFATYGYSLVASLIIILPIYFIMFLVMIIMALV